MKIPQYSINQPKDYQDLNKAAAAHLERVRDEIVDYRGRPCGSTSQLNPSAPPRRMKEWRLYDSGHFVDLTTGNSGDLIDLIAYLADVPRPRAAKCLHDVVKQVAGRRAA